MRLGIVGALTVLVLGVFLVVPEVEAQQVHFHVQMPRPYYTPHHHHYHQPRHWQPHHHHRQPYQPHHYQQRYGRQAPVHIHPPRVDIWAGGRGWSFRIGF